MSYPFNVRVYGVVMGREGKILVSDEYFHNTFITKFVGGGLEFGEGTLDCLKREFKEELNMEIEILSHIYTTDFFQASAFDSKKQIISIYYLVKLVKQEELKTSIKKFDFPELKNNSQSFRWVNLNTGTESEMTFPIDKKVIQVLLNWKQGSG